MLRRATQVGCDLDFRLGGIDRGIAHWPHRGRRNRARSGCKPAPYVRGYGCPVGAGFKPARSANPGKSQPLAVLRAPGQPRRCVVQMVPHGSLPRREGPHPHLWRAADQCCVVSGCTQDSRQRVSIDASAQIGATTSGRTRSMLPPSPDYAELKRRIKDAGLLEPQPRYFALKFASTALLYAINIAIVLVFESPRRRPRRGRLPRICVHARGVPRARPGPSADHPPFAPGLDARAHHRQPAHRRELFVVDGQAQPAPCDAESQRAGSRPGLSDAGLRVSADQGLQARLLSDHCVSGRPVPVPGRVSGVWDAGAGRGAGAERQVAAANGRRTGAGAARAALRRVVGSNRPLGTGPGVPLHSSDDVRSLQHAGLRPQPQGHADDR